MLTYATGGDKIAAAYAALGCKFTYAVRMLTYADVCYRACDYGCDCRSVCRVGLQVHDLFSTPQALSQTAIYLLFYCFTGKNLQILTVFSAPQLVRPQEESLGG